MFSFFNATATTAFSTLSLHDALPIFDDRDAAAQLRWCRGVVGFAAHHAAGQHVVCEVNSLGRSRGSAGQHPDIRHARSEEHTSELQSLTNLVCRLLLEKKKEHDSIDD